MPQIVGLVDDTRANDEYGNLIQNRVGEVRGNLKNFL